MKVHIIFHDHSEAFKTNGLNEYAHVLNQALAALQAAKGPGISPLVDSTGHTVGRVGVAV